MQQLLDSIADTIKDYRQGEVGVPAMNPQHVEKWIKRFDENTREPILEEMDHVLKKTYFSKDYVSRFLSKLLKNGKLTDSNYTTFWQDCTFLSHENLGTQVRGRSQADLLKLFDTLLEEHVSYKLENCSAKAETNRYIYLDDISFTGDHLKNHLIPWIETNAPHKATLHIILIAYHLYGQYKANNDIQQAINKSQKDIKIHWWYCMKLENRQKYVNDSDVLHPLRIPEIPNVTQYAQSIKHPKYDLVIRENKSVGKSNIFSSLEKRDLLEQEFLKVGVKIREDSGNFGPAHKPLGYLGFPSLGFGSLLVTFRNCPNNCPLALWANDPWYPLFPRLIN